MKILIINAGSSSLKYQLIDMDNEQVIAKGLAERIGIAGSHLEQKVGDKKIELDAAMANHVDAMNYVIKALTDPEKGAIKSMDEIGAVGHRVLHGGEKYTKSVLINDDVKATIREYIPLGPLHNPANLQGIEACEKVMPTTPMVAVFDTGFHQTMPPKAYLYALPMKYYRELKVRRYGFHGTSHRFVSGRCCQLLGGAEGTRIIVCHLGNGSSLSAVVDGKCVDTSMGITPLEGVVMGTRSGDLDPACLQYIMNNSKNDDGTPIDIDQMLNILNKKSGSAGPEREVQRHARRHEGRRRGRRTVQADAGHLGVLDTQVHRRVCGGDGRSGCAGVHGGRGREQRRAARDGLRGSGLDGHQDRPRKEQGPSRRVRDLG